MKTIVQDAEGCTVSICTQFWLWVLGHHVEWLCVYMNVCYFMEGMSWNEDLCYSLTCVKIGRIHACPLNREFSALLGKFYICPSTLTSMNEVMVLEAVVGGCCFLVGTPSSEVFMSKHQGAQRTVLSKGLRHLAIEFLPFPRTPLFFFFSGPC